MATAPLNFLTACKRLFTIIKRKRTQLLSTSGFQGDQVRETLPFRLLEVVLKTWDLGFTAFGGPPVHFQIIYSRFVHAEGRRGWVDDQTYQELFAICQGLPGPGSTKMLFCVTLIHAGFVPAVLVFFLWSFPGAFAMYGLSLGVQRISETLPAPVYALLSGLNASTVGIIALAAVQLAEKSIKDDLTRILVLFGACAGVCYNALWFFPALLIAGGLATFLWDGLIKPWVGRVKAKRRSNSCPDGSRERGEGEGEEDANVTRPGVSMAVLSPVMVDTVLRRKVDLPDRQTEVVRGNAGIEIVTGEAAELQTESTHTVKIRVGVCILVIFFASFITVILIRAFLRPLPLSFSLFSNMYLAGTIIFGGGPVVIPLLRSYVVDPGWVSSRDFLLGLAIIQAMPGPNFNFAVYLGALALQRDQLPTIFGSMIAFVGIFLPGLALAVAVQGFWRVMRTKPWVVHVLRGVNATAVGLVFTAVYRLWEIGYLTERASQGQSLGLNPWWVVVTAITYAASAWFKVPPALAIVFGAVLGLCWYGAVGR